VPSRHTVEHAVAGMAGYGWLRSPMGSLATVVYIVAPLASIGGSAINFPPLLEDLGSPPCCFELLELQEQTGVPRHQAATATQRPARALHIQYLYFTDQVRCSQARRSFMVSSSTAATDSWRNHRLEGPEEACSFLVTLG